MELSFASLRIEQMRFYGADQRKTGLIGVHCNLVAKTVSGKQCFNLDSTIQGQEGGAYYIQGQEGGGSITSKAKKVGGVLHQRPRIRVISMLSANTRREV